MEKKVKLNSSKNPTAHHMAYMWYILVDMYDRPTALSIHTLVFSLYMHPPIIIIQILFFSSSQKKRKK